MNMLRNDPIMKMHQELNGNPLYNSTIRHMTNAKLKAYIKEYDPEWKQRYTGGDGLIERCHKVMKLAKKGGRPQPERG